MKTLALASLMILFVCLAAPRHPTSASATPAETLRFISIDPALTRNTGVSGFTGGLGVSLGAGRDVEGYPSILSHSGAQDNASAYFYLDRAKRNGIVIMVNGEYSWMKNGAEYGAYALRVDISEAFFRYYS